MIRLFIASSLFIAINMQQALDTWLATEASAEISFYPSRTQLPESGYCRCPLRTVRLRRVTDTFFVSHVGKSISLGLCYLIPLTIIRVAKFDLKVGSQRTTKIKNLVVLVIILVAHRIICMWFLVLLLLLLLVRER